MQFYGREEEIELLNKLTKKKTASLVVLRGRRRIGKSSLAEHVGRNYHFLEFAGLPPPPDGNITAQQQREIFAEQLQRQLHIPKPRAENWGDLFTELSRHIPNKQTFILLDEITWMGNKDPAFLGNLKTCWDQRFKHYKLVLIISGSASGWIEKNILTNTGFLGRVSLDLTLDELPLNICNKFWGKYADNTSAYEKLKFLAITGGIPRYLEELYPDETAMDNIQRLCFNRAGFLFTEFDKIFSDLFDKRASTYKKIVASLSNGAAKLEDIYAALGADKSGTISEYVDDLVSCGFIRREYTWNIASGVTSRLSVIRLSDNYLRFYVQYIDSHKTAIMNRVKIPFDYSATILGLQFENLVLTNRHLIIKQLNINPANIVADGPFFQTHTKRNAGCQIDYLIQTKDRCLYICEIKFNKDRIGNSIVKEMQEKIQAMSIPKHYSYRTVLIHVNGVTDELLDSDYFSYLIDFAKFFE